MLNVYSPAHDFLPPGSDPPGAALLSAPASAARPVRYPSPPPGLRLLRLQLGVLRRLAPAMAFRRTWRLFCTPRRLPRKAWEAAVLAQARTYTVAHSTGPVAVYEWGAASQPAVVLVHGWEHRASFWGAWVGPLRAAGFRVIALDGPAHGASAGRQVDLVGFGQAVAAVLASAGAVRAVVAHSFGAASVAGLPVRLPGAGVLPRLALLSAPLSPLEVAGRFADLLGQPGSLVARMSRHIEQQTGREARSFAAAAAGPTLGAEQVLIVHDEDDEIVPFAEGQQIAAAWPGARLYATRGLGHNRILRDAQVVRQVVAFVAA